MSIPQRVTNFLKCHEEKTKEEILQLLMSEFCYIKATADAYYSLHFKSKKLKDTVFNFLSENPEALKNNIIKEYTNKLGISKTTYLKYKNLYIEIQSGIITKENLKESDRKNRNETKELDNQIVITELKENKCLNQRCLLNKNKKCINDVVLSGRAPCLGKDQVKSKQKQIAFNNTQSLFVDWRL